MQFCRIVKFALAKVNGKCDGSADLHMKVTVFEIRTREEAVVVLDDILQILKLRRARPDATGARVAAIGRIQDQLEAERQALVEQMAFHQAVSGGADSKLVEVAS